MRGWSGPSFARRIAAASVNSDLASLFFPIFSCTNPICCFVLAHRGWLWPNTWVQSYVKPKSVQVVYSIGVYAVSQCCYSHRLACLALLHPVSRCGQVHTQHCRSVHILGRAAVPFLSPYAVCAVMLDYISSRPRVGWSWPTTRILISSIFW